jgi:hypothetical protein
MGIRYALGLTTAQLLLGEQGRIDAQRRVFVNATPGAFTKVMDITQEAVDATPDGDEGSFVRNNGYTFPVAGSHLVLVLDTALTSPDGVAVVTFAVTVAGGGTDTATATFAVPTSAADQTKVYGKCTMVDIIPVTDATKKITAITGTGVTIANGEVGARFKVLSAPAANDATWVEALRVRGFDAPIPSGMAVEIPHNFDAALDSVRGREDSPKLSGSMVLAANWADLRRYNEVTVAFKVEDWVDGKVRVSNEIYGGVTLTLSKASADGNGEQRLSFTGLYSEFGMVLA